MCIRDRHHLLGAVPALRGSLQSYGARIDLVRQTRAAAVRAGLAFLPGDRQGASGAGGLPALDNLSLIHISEPT